MSIDYTEYESFLSSEYFVPEPNNWHLKEGAPQEAVDAFNDFMEKERKVREEGWY